LPDLTESCHALRFGAAVKSSTKCAFQTFNGSNPCQFTFDGINCSIDCYYAVAILQKTLKKACAEQNGGIYPLTRAIAGLLVFSVRLHSSLYYLSFAHETLRAGKRKREKEKRKKRKRKRKKRQSWSSLRSLLFAFNQPLQHHVEVCLLFGADAVTACLALVKRLEIHLLDQIVH